MWNDGAKTQVIAGGKSLECAMWGAPPSDAPTIVMLHEGLGCIELWRDFPQRLAAATGFGVIAFSRAGYGQSDPAELPRQTDYMTREAMDVLPDVLDQIGVRHAVLLGHSDGATIAANYAGSVQDHRVRGLVLMAPHFFTETDGLAQIARARDAYEAGDMKARMAKYHSDPDATFYGWNDIWLHPKFRDWNVAEVIDYIRVPVLAIQGAQDQYGTMAQIDEIADRCYAPVDVEIIENCQHSPHVEHPDRTLDVIADFARHLERIESESVATA